MDISTLDIGDAVFRVIDLETTGLDPALDGVCEIAWRDVLATGEELTLITQQSLIDPGIPIPPGASAIHHLVDEDVAGARKLSEILPLVKEPVIDHSGAGADASGQVPVFVAHNAAFERSFLGIDGPWLCTNRMALHAWPELESHANQYLRYALGLKPDIARTDPVHRAAADVAVTLQVLFAGLGVLKSKWPDVSTVGDLIDRIERPALLHRLPFKSSGYIPFEQATDEHLEWIVSRQAGGSDCVHTALYWLDVRRQDRCAASVGEIPF